MVKNYKLRSALYNEERVVEDGISHQVCVVIDHIHNKKVSYYESTRENGLLVEGDVLYADVPLQGIERIIFYVNNDSIALDLAHRWCKDNTCDEHQYKVIGVDSYFSPLN